VAGSFGSDAARYDRTRPGYPDELVERIVGASPGRRVLDVGIGTGIAARQFRAAGCRVEGVDVDERMAALARARGFDVEVAAFESWDPGGRAFDIVVAAQAWHWVDPVAGATKAASVLRPGGRLAAFWNVFDPPAEIWQALEAVYRRVLPEGTFGGLVTGIDAYRAILDAAAEGIRASGAFVAPDEWRVDWVRHYGRDEWLEQVPTFGGFAQFDPPVQDALLEGFGAAVDRVGGSFSMGYAAVAVTASLPAPSR
jgi:SAM-dependent methyltransferase